MKREEGLITDRKKGRKPTLHIVASTIPRAWEKTLFEVWEKGVSVETDYDVEAVGEPPSKEACVLVEVTSPLKEPRIHKRALPEGYDSLQKYVMEICEGIHDHWVKIKKDDGTPIWDYSYHERLFAYPVYDKEGNLIKRINQIEDLMQKLKKENHITKSAQAIIWLPGSDHYAGHSPCLQRVQLRLIPEEIKDGKVVRYALNMDTTWRSRDLKNAWFENVYGFTELQKIFANQLTESLGIETRVGSYTDFSNSLHIYGRDFNPNVRIKGGEVTKFEDFINFLDSLKNTAWKDKTVRSDDPIVRYHMEEEKIALLADPDYTRKGGASAKPKILYKPDEVFGEVPHGAIINNEKFFYKDGKLVNEKGKVHTPKLMLG